MRLLLATLLLLAIALSVADGAGIARAQDRQRLMEAHLKAADPPRPPAKLDSSLYSRLAHPAAEALSVPQALPGSELVQVEVEATRGSEDEVHVAIQRLGGEVQASRGPLVQALMPLGALAELAQEPAVVAVRRPLRLRPQAIVSEGTSLMGSGDWQRAGLSGRGVRVGIVDTFGGYQQLLGSELPANVVFRDFTSPRPPDPCDSPTLTRHGTAVAEIVADVAPGAQLFLAQADTSLELAQAVDWLLGQGVQVVNFSAGFPGARPYGTMGSSFDIFVDSVDRAAGAGVLWVNSAGNSADSQWAGSWTDADGDGLLDFAPGDDTDDLALPSNTVSCLLLVLVWDDAWGGACQDYALLVGYFDSRGQPQTIASDDRQDCSEGAVPREFVDITSVTTSDRRLYIAVRKRPDAQPRRLRLLVLGVGDLQHVVPAGSVLPPADRPTALAVGAVPVSNPTAVEPFSSRGPTWDGRVKPDLVAPDRVSTVSYGPGGFAGTSASAPHVAGAAALLKEANPGWSAPQLRQSLESQAVDLGPPGKDNIFGSGRVRMGPPPPAGPPPAPALVSLAPQDAASARLTWQPPQQVASYRLCASLDPDFSFGVSCREVPASEAPGSLAVGVPWWDMGVVYYRLQACNPFGCSQPAPAGAVGRRVWPGEGDWNFYLTAVPVFGRARVAVWNASPVPGKVSDLALWSGVAGLGGQMVHACPAVPPGQGCGPVDMEAPSGFVSATQAFPPFGAAGIALRLL
ncbi:MAG TPA: S8 family serine peptidase [Dehalococcoidia bacterium]|nr:S8 family serine peptidase [Dehalococcoidia bacterium]